MFFHKFKYTFKYLFKNKSLLFWTFIFPIILSICFYVAFKDIESNEKLKIIDIAVVQNEQFESSMMIKETLNYLSKENDNQIFNIKYTDKDDAEKLLDSDEIIGYLLIDTEPNIKIKSNGINETIFKYIVEEAYSNSLVINDYINDGVLYDKIVEKIMFLTEEHNYTKNETNSHISYTMIEYYTLIAMTALYCGMIAINVINKEMANISSIGKRNGVSPIKKSTGILGSLSAAYFVGLIGLSILFIFTIFALKVDYGDYLYRVILIGMLGILAGESLGIFIGTNIKGSENTKTGILIAITMTGSFLSGMMGITMKYLVDSNVPIINLINPAAIITDGLYSVYYYEGLSRYYFNIISLIIFSSILIILSVIKIRRVKYDSI